MTVSLHFPSTINCGSVALKFCLRLLSPRDSWMMSKDY